jgi:hypothetical protein
MYNIITIVPGIIQERFCFIPIKIIYRGHFLCNGKLLPRPDDFTNIKHRAAHGIVIEHEMYPGDGPFGGIINRTAYSAIA